jgi:hypothetical protein
MYCSTPRCNDPVRSRGLCRKCYDNAYFGRGQVAGLLSVECWCKRQIVMVSKADVMRGRTRTCGLQQCKQEATV